MKKHLIYVSLLFLISCSSIAPMSKFHIKEIAQIGNKHIAKKYNEEVTYKDMIIRKKTYGKWFVIAYGDLFLYKLEIDEDGNIISEIKEDYKN